MAQPDTIAANELKLYGDNESKLYPLKQNIEANLLKKAKKGTYQHGRAPKAWMYFADASAKAYTKEFGGGSGRSGSFGVFDKATRELAAKMWADEFAEEHGLPRGKAKKLPARKSRR